MSHEIVVNGVTYVRKDGQSSEIDIHKVSLDNIDFKLEEETKSCVLFNKNTSNTWIRVVFPENKSPIIYYFEPAAAWSGLGIHTDEIGNIVQIDIAGHLKGIMNFIDS